MYFPTAKAETVVTTDQGVRGGRIIELKKVVDDAVSKCPTVKRVFVSKRTGANVPMGKMDIPLEEVKHYPVFVYVVHMCTLGTVCRQVPALTILKVCK